MLRRLLFPAMPDLCVMSLVSDVQKVEVAVRVTRRTARCPLCAGPSGQRETQTFKKAALWRRAASVGVGQRSQTFAEDAAGAGGAATAEAPRPHPEDDGRISPGPVGEAACVGAMDGGGGLSTEGTPCPGLDRGRHEGDALIDHQEVIDGEGGKVGQEGDRVEIHDGLLGVAESIHDAHAGDALQRRGRCIKSVPEPRASRHRAGPTAASVPT